MTLWHHSTFWLWTGILKLSLTAFRRWRGTEQAVLWPHCTHKVLVLTVIRNDWGLVRLQAHHLVLKRLVPVNTPYLVVSLHKGFEFKLLKKRWWTTFNWVWEWVVFSSRHGTEVKYMSFPPLLLIRLSFSMSIWLMTNHCLGRPETKSSSETSRGKKLSEWKDFCATQLRN